MAVPASFTGDLVNTATVAVGPGNADPNPDNNFAPDTDTLDRHANLSISKTSNTSPVTSGGTVTYSIVATNNGPSAADNAIVTLRTHPAPAPAA